MVNYLAYINRNILAFVQAPKLANSLVATQ
jgi:hypothetical protein